MADHRLELVTCSDTHMDLMTIVGRLRSNAYEVVAKNSTEPLLMAIVRRVEKYR